MGWPVPLAFPDDVSVRVSRPTTQADLALIEAALDDVSALIRDATGRDWPDAVTVPAAVRTVAARAAARVVDNPAGLLGETTPDYSYRRDPGTGPYLTPTEVRTVRRAARRIGLHTVPVTRDEDQAVTVARAS